MKRKLVHLLIYVGFAFTTIGVLVPIHVGADVQQHLVKKGETLWGISRKYKVPLKSIIRVNNIQSGNYLRAGEKLVIPGGAVQEELDIDLPIPPAPKPLPNKGSTQEFNDFDFDFLNDEPLPNKGPTRRYKYHTTLTGHTGAVRSITFSPDGKILASGSPDKTIRLWDVETSQQLNTLTGHTDSVNSVAFSPNGTTLASASTDSTIRLWDIQTGQLLNTLIGHGYVFNSVAFSPDGKTLASDSSNRTISLWDVETGQPLKTFTGHTDSVTSVAFSPDGQTLASGSVDKTVRLWDVETGQPLKTFTRHRDLVWSVVFSPDGQTLSSSSADTTIRLWDVPTGRCLHIFMGANKNVVNSIAFSPDGQTFANGNPFDWFNSTVDLWNVKRGVRQIKLTGHTNTVTSVVFSPDGETLASGSIDKTIRLWKSTPYKSSAEQTYDTAIRAVMWIVNPGVNQGSGMLIDDQFKLAVTNAHVTDTQSSVDVYFPAPDENGELIKDRDFYLENREVLKRLGYYTRGQVVARNAETDLAIIKLEGLPETAREIKWNYIGPDVGAGDLVYILGNPVGQELWRWTLGEYRGGTEDFLHIQSDVFGGNSGGPVLNKEGILLGIVARSDTLMNAFAIPVIEITELIAFSGLKLSRNQ